MTGDSRRATHKGKLRNGDLPSNMGRNPSPVYLPSASLHRSETQDVPRQSCRIRSDQNMTREIRNIPLTGRRRLNECVENISPICACTSEEETKAPRDAAWSIYKRHFSKISNGTVRYLLVSAPVAFITTAHACT